jgi:putative tricarboxylic transport membrane protein
MLGMAQHVDFKNAWVAPEAYFEGEQGMSEGVGPAAADPRGPGLNQAQYDYIAGMVLIAISLIGPVLALIFGQDHTPLEALRLGGYSLPLALAGIAIFVMGVRNPRDYYGGVVLVALSLFALWASNDLPGMRGFAFGPGTAPRLFAYCLIAVGVAVALMGLFTDGPPQEQFAFSGPLGGAVLVVALIPITYFSGRIGHMLPGIAPDIIVAAVGAIVVLVLAFVMIHVAPRGPVFITAATLIFAVTVRPVGLVIASFVSLVVSAYATEEIRWLETLIWCAVLTLFCSLLFPYGLNLPLQLWPRF